MKLLRITTLTAMFLFSSTWVLAADPRVHVDDPTGSFTPVGFTFMFTSNAFGGGESTFSNASGVTFKSLEINVAAPMPPGPITCGGNAFTHCFEEPSPDGGFATIDFFGGPGIANGRGFSINLGTTGWTPNATFTAFATGPQPTPEPGMLTLVASGLGVLLLRSKSSAQPIAGGVAKILNLVWQR